MSAKNNEDIALKKIDKKLQRKKKIKRSRRNVRHYLKEICRDKDLLKYGDDVFENLGR